MEKWIQHALSISKNIQIKYYTHTNTHTNGSIETEEFDSLSHIKACIHAVVIPLLLLITTHSLLVAMIYFGGAYSLYKTKFANSISARLFFTVAKNFYSVAFFFLLFYFLTVFVS